MSSCFSPCSCSCTPCCCNSCNDNSTTGNTTTTTTNPNISTTTTEFVCDDIIPIECIIYNGTFLNEYGINPGDSLLDIINLISQFLCPCTTTTTLEPCVCYKIFNCTEYTLNYTTVDCFGLETSGTLLSGQTKYVCSRPSGFEYDAAIEVDTETTLTCTGQTPTCANPPLKCHTITVTGSAVVSYTNVSGIQQFVTIVNDTIKICAWQGSVVKATGTGTANITPGASCTQDSECNITTTTSSSTSTTSTSSTSSTTSTTTIPCYCYLVHNISGDVLFIDYDSCDPQQPPFEPLTLEAGRNVYVCSTEDGMSSAIPGQLEVTNTGICTNDCTASQAVCIKITVTGTVKLGWINYDGYDSSETVTDDIIYKCAWSNSVYKISGAGSFETLEGGACTLDSQCQDFTTSTTTTSTSTTTSSTTTSTTQSPIPPTSSTTTTSSSTTTSTTVAPCYGYSLSLNTNTCFTNGILAVYDITGGTPGSLVIEYNTDNGPHSSSLLIMPGSTYRIQGKWDGGSGNEVRMRICNLTLGTEEFYTSTPLTTSNISAYFDIAVPSSITTCYSYGAFLSSCNEIPPDCAV